MTYGTAAKNGGLEYKISIYSEMTGPESAWVGVGADITFTVTDILNSTSAVDGDAIGDPNFQALLDHLATFPGFHAPAGSRVDTVTYSGTGATKSYSMRGEVTPTQP